MIRMLDHEMDVEWKLGVLSHGRDDSWPERNIIDEVAVHDVEMQPIGAGLFGAMDLGFETREVRGEDGRSDEGFHAEETILRKTATGKLSNVFLFRYLFFISREEAKEEGRPRPGPSFPLTRRESVSRYYPVSAGRYRARTHGAVRSKSGRASDRLDSAVQRPI
jgi:hypothetical protein